MLPQQLHHPAAGPRVPGCRCRSLAAWTRPVRGKAEVEFTCKTQPLNPLFHKFMKLCSNHVSPKAPVTTWPGPTAPSARLSWASPCCCSGLFAVLPSFLRWTLRGPTGHLPVLTSVLHARASPRGSSSCALSSDRALFSLRTVSIFLIISLGHRLFRNGCRISKHLGTSLCC